MPLLKKSPQADQDLLEICLHIAEDSPINADYGSLSGQNQ